MDDANETVNVEVTIEFSNEDPAGARSLGIDEEPDRWTAGGTRRSGVR